MTPYRLALTVYTFDGKAKRKSGEKEMILMLFPEEHSIDVILMY